ncbi:carbohydrate ABC transporter permease [Paenibacillus abyssi]|uniref:ABC transporter permease n=1 Tax=Paenibacillus abyssi TaxID=1340531 RepID=A0A917CQ81_9BACL|nr:sugar ABC transporter permease [Paenibacillus abyssi]GGF93552.1 ABC transporter permease [Paenibacillus abyssi]
MKKPRGTITKHLLVAPALVMFLAVTIFPLLFTLVLSFSNWKLGGKMQFAGFDNYKRAFTDELFLKTLLITCVIVVVAVAIEYVLGFLLAMTVNKVVRGKKAIRILILLPMMLAPVVIGFMWKMLFDESYGPINHFLGFLGLPTVSWITNSTMAVISVILVDVWEWTPLIALILMAGFQSLPKEPYESARVDGSSEWKIFKDLTFPMLIPASIAAILLRSIETFKIFDTIFVITSGGPGTATTTSTIYAYTVGLRNFNLSYAAAICIILLIIVVVLCTVFLKLVLKKRKNIELPDEGAVAEMGVAAK